jgi:hypothetical protein
MMINASKPKRRLLSMARLKHLRRMRQEARRVRIRDDQKKNGLPGLKGFVTASSGER